MAEGSRAANHKVKVKFLANVQERGTMRIQLRVPRLRGARYRHVGAITLLYSTLTTVEISAPIDDYDRLKALGDSDRTAILKPLCQAWGR